MLILAVGSTAEAQTTPPATPLARLFAEADAKNAEIRAALRSVDVQRARRIQVSLPPAQFDATSRIEPDLPKGLGTIRTTAATVTQQYGPRTARFAAQDAADAAVVGAEATAAATVRSVRMRIVNAYYALAGAQAGRANADETVRLALELERTARIRERAGDIGRFDLQRTSVEVSRAQSEVQKAIGSENVARIALNTAVGLAPAAPTIATLAQGDAGALDAESKRGPVIARDPQSAQLTALIREARARELAAAAQRRPTFSLTAGVQTSSIFPAGATSFGPVVGIGISAPVGDRGTISGAVAEAQATRRVAEAQLTGRAATLQGEIASAAAALSAGQARLRFARESRERAEQIVRTALIGFRSGALGALDVISTRSALTAAKALENDAATDYATAVGTLRLLLESSP